MSRGGVPSPHGGDPELASLLLDELRKHAPALDPDAPEVGQRRAVHALKGSAAIAGERGLSESLARIERRLHAGDPLAVDDARALVTAAAFALEAGRSPSPSLWPDPPADLQAAPLEPGVAARYRAEMADRLARVDGALAASGDDLGATLAAFRDVHAMKGAAHAASDEVTAWFCHGLEEILRAGQRSEDEARAALAELTRWRGVLAELIAAPERALETLRLLAHPQRQAPLPASASSPSDPQGRPPAGARARRRPLAVPRPRGNPTSTRGRRTRPCASPPPRSTGSSSGCGSSGSRVARWRRTRSSRRPWGRVPGPSA